MTPEESFENLTSTSLWQHTLGKDDPHVKPLRESFLRSRENAAYLLAKIRKDFPDLTIHDITHVDSLWRVANTIIGPEYPINPLEGYILGIAFLIHDAAHSYDAVGGKEALRNTTEWKDFYSGEHDGMDEEEFKKACDFATIRALHAKKAGEMLSKTFTRDNGTTFYLIDNDSYRTHYGELIGKIAESHHWDIDRVNSDLGTQEPPLDNMPGDWEINSQKLACILRCADAGHIDNGRAPDNIYFDRSLAINNVSRDYWAAQNHLGQLLVDRDDKSKLLVKSTNPFPKSEFAAWNVAYEAVVQLDTEIKRSNELLKSLSTDTENLVFPRVGVEGSGTKEMLAKHIKTIGWNPCDMIVHTSNVKALIENLGGSKLYGEKNMLLVALRELIQNARDAIHARRTMDPEHFGIDDGKITIRLIEEGGKHTIEVEDNGIGMSRECIKNYMLNFGSSYWKSALAVMENPGLRGKGFTSVGKFGIGFYSIFMVAKSVNVVTRRFKKEATRKWDSKENDAIRVEFPEGLTLSPILSSDTLSTSVSTVVRFELKKDVETNFIIDENGYYINKQYPISLSKALSILTIGLDTDVFFGSLRIHPNVRSPNFDKKEWLKKVFLKHYNIDLIASKIEGITDEQGKPRGYLLPPQYYARLHNLFYASTIGGLSSIIDLHYSSYMVSQTPHKTYFFGYLDVEDTNVNREYIPYDKPLIEIIWLWVKKHYTEDHYTMFIKYQDWRIDPLPNIYENIFAWYNKVAQKFIEENCINDIIQDNVRRIYSTYSKNKNLAEKWNFYDIGIFLYIGTQYRTHVDRLQRTNDVSKLTLRRTPISKLFPEEIQRIIGKSYIFHSDGFEDIDWVLGLIKYLTDGFLSKVSEASFVWVNLILDSHFQVMIDWRKAGMDYSIYYNMSSVEVINYLKQFLSSTYLEEITASVEGEDE